MKLYLRVFSYYRPFLGRIFIGLGLMLVSILLNLLKPWPLKFVVDYILKQDATWNGFSCYANEKFLLMLVGILLVIHLLWGVFQVAHTYWFIRIGLAALLKLRTQLYSYLQELSFRFHDNSRSADSTYRVAYDSQAIQTFFNRGFVTTLSCVVTLIGAWILMYHLSPRLSFFSLLVIPMLLGAIYFFAAQIRRQTHQLQKEETDIFSKVSEDLANLRVIRAYGREEHEVRQFQSEVRESLMANLKLNMTNSWSAFAVGLVMAFGTAGLLYLGAHEVMGNRMTIGDMLVFLAYLAMLYQPLEQLSYTAWALEGAAAGMERSFEILDTPNDVVDLPHAQGLRISQAVIEIQNVHFSYQPDRPILQGVSLSIQAGQTIAIVGSTGSGKSTLLSLIPRFYDPTQGAIFIDGQDIRQVMKGSLREQISIVLQETLLFNTTIRENIAYGNPQASFQEIREAARMAQIDEFIQQLPQGYKTLVGERGVKLSGGQRQRIGIARAFLKKSPILLLDEPTSALDLETESEILLSLSHLMRDKTTIIVTHRLSTIHQVDKIYVLEEGRLVEEGTGAELLEKKGFYWKLWTCQDIATQDV